MSNELVRQHERNLHIFTAVTERLINIMFDIEDMTAFDLKDLFANSERLFEKVYHLEEAAEEVGNVLTELEESTKSIGNMIQNITEAKGKDEADLRNLQAEKDKAEEAKNTASKQYDQCVRQLSQAESELSTEENKLAEAQKTQKNCDDAAEAGIVVGGSGAAVGGIIALFGFVFPPAAVAGAIVAAASAGTGAGTVLTAAIIAKSPEEMKLLRDNRDYAQRRVNSKKDEKDEALLRYNRCNTLIVKKRDQIKEKEETLKKLKVYQKKMEKCKKYVIDLLTMFHPVQGSLNMLKDALKDHYELGQSKKMEKITMNAYADFQETWEGLKDKSSFQLLHHNLLENTVELTKDLAQGFDIGTDDPTPRFGRNGAEREGMEVECRPM